MHMLKVQVKKYYGAKMQDIIIIGFLLTFSFLSKEIIVYLESI